MGLSGADHDAVHRAVHDVACVVDVAEFPAAVLGLLRDLIPCDGAGYNEVDPTIPRIVYVTDPPDYVPEDFAERWEAHAHLHPILRHMQETGDGTAHMISDFQSDAEYRAGDLYRNVYGDVPINYQMVAALPTEQPLMIALVVTRADDDFSSRDREVLNLVRPVLAQLYRSAQLHTELTAALQSMAAFDTVHRAVVYVDPGGEWTYPDPDAAPRVERWLRGFDRAELDRWCAAQQTRTVPGSVPASAGLLTIEHGDRRVTVRMFAARVGPDVLVFEESRHAVAPSALEALGLSPREAEVLALVAQGLTNAAVGARLGVGVATVRKHLEHVYRKLDVQSRTEAVVAVYDRLADPTS